MNVNLECEFGKGVNKLFPRRKKKQLWTEQAQRVQRTDASEKATENGSYQNASLLAQGDEKREWKAQEI